MKSIACALLLFLAFTAYGRELGNGQPGCKTEEELEVVYYRNFWDASAFWKCEKLDEPAVYVRCPDEHGFQGSLRKCVSWEDWTWEDPRAPPSFPEEN